MTLELILGGLCALVLSPCPTSAPTTLTALLPAGDGMKHEPQLWAEWEDRESGKRWDFKTVTPVGTFVAWKLEGRIKISVDGSPLDLGKFSKLDDSIMNLGDAVKQKSKLVNIDSRALNPVNTDLVKALVAFPIIRRGRGKLEPVKENYCTWQWHSEKEKPAATGLKISIDDAKEVKFEIDKNLDGTFEAEIVLSDKARPNGRVPAWILNSPTPSDDLPDPTLDHFYLYYALSTEPTNDNEGKNFKIKCKERTRAEGASSGDAHGSHGANTGNAHTSKASQEKFRRLRFQGKPVACAVCQGCG